MSKYTIGQIAKISGVPAKTLRFYEEQGIVKSAGRGENGYRFYDENNLEEIRLIKNARDLGLPLVEIKKLTLGCDQRGCEHSKEYIQENIERYQKLLSERIKQMTNLRDRLEMLLKNGPYCCEILHQLSINTGKAGEK